MTEKRLFAKVGNTVTGNANDRLSEAKLQLISSSVFF